jgi:hypothetical protein
VRPLHDRWLAMFARNRQAIARRLDELTRLGPQVLAQETQAEAVTWWRKHLTRPQLRAAHWMTLIGAALCAALISYEQLAINPALRTASISVFANAHPLIAFAIGAVAWLLAVMLGAQLAIELRYCWRQAFGAKVDRQLAHLRHTPRGRALLLLGTCLLLPIVALPLPGWARTAAALCALIAVSTVYGRLALRLAAPAALCGEISQLTLTAWAPDAFGAFGAGFLFALLAYCALAFALHDHLVRRGWPIERITRTMRSLVVTYWLLPLVVVTVIATVRSAMR